MRHLETGENYIENSQKNYDHQWYDRLKENGSFYASTYLSVDSSVNKEQKDAFFAGEIDSPAPEYPKLNFDDLEDKERALITLKNDIIQNENNATVKQAYRWKINEKIATIRMLKETLSGNDHRFFRYSKFIYGSPENNIHNYTLWQLQKKMDAIIQDPHTSALQKSSASEILSLSQDTNETTVEQFEKIEPIQYISTQETFSAEEIRSAFSEALTQKGFSEWQVLVGEKTTLITTSQEKRTITIPKNRTVDYLKLRGLIEHEIGTHVQRRESGERTKLSLLGIGLDRYGAGEEGLATHAESMITGADDYAGFAGHFATSLACGIDGHKRSFREVFTILKNYHLATGKDTSSASNDAYKLCIKTFRGTTFKTPGACFTSNIEYREGNIGIHQLVNKDDPEKARFLVGKYDPANPRHIWILDQLNITEKDLEDLSR